MLGLTILCGSAACLIGAGVWSRTAKSGKTFRNPQSYLTAAMAFSFLTLLFSATAVFAAEVSPTTAAATSATGLGLIGAALSTGLACIGAGIGVAFVGAAALGVVGEKPALFGTTLIYMGLAEGIAIYGLVISLFILGKV
ncbi:MAG: ATP synthase subunit C [Synergistaceae bacterium]|jgi:V/A-type H+-transporting ATPase subunit K|nr:ATP synthase subunit C [Synergistaceae bacterium]